MPERSASSAAEPSMSMATPKMKTIPCQKDYRNSFTTEDDTSQHAIDAQVLREFGESMNKIHPCPNDFQTKFLTIEDAKKHAVTTCPQEPKSSIILTKLSTSLPQEGIHGSYEHLEVTPGRVLFFRKHKDWDSSKFVPGVEAVDLCSEYFKTQDTHIEAIITASPQFRESLYAFRCSNYIGASSTTANTNAIRLAKACPNLQHVSFEGAQKLDDLTLLSFLKECKNLRYIAITGKGSGGLGAIKRSAIDVFVRKPELGRYLRKLCLLDQNISAPESLESLYALCVVRADLVVVHGLTSIFDIRFWKETKKTYIKDKTVRDLGIAGWSPEILSRHEIKEILESEIVVVEKNSEDNGSDVSQLSRKRERTVAHCSDESKESEGPTLLSQLEESLRDILEAEDSVPEMDDDNSLCQEGS